MAEKDFTFTLLIPLRLEHYVDVRSLNDGLKSISFNIDFEKNYCSIFARCNNDRFIIDSVKEFSFAPFKDKNFLYYNAYVSAFKDVFKNGLQKENEKELVSEEFPKRSRSKKS